MFADQRNLGITALKTKAAGLSLDAEKFNACLDSGKMAAAVKADTDMGLGIGVNSTPSLYVNGRPLTGAASLDSLSRLIDEELARAGAAS